MELQWLRLRQRMHPCSLRKRRCFGHSLVPSASAAFLPCAWLDCLLSCQLNYNIATISSNRTQYLHFRRSSNPTANLSSTTTRAPKLDTSPAITQPSTTKHNGANTPGSCSPGEQYSEPKPNQKTSRSQRSYSRTETSLN